MVKKRSVDEFACFHVIISKNPFSNLLQRIYCGDFDPENAYRKPPVILKIVPKAGYVTYVHWK